jgi:tRNA (guanine10-N2)-methyltransferase
LTKDVFELWGEGTDYEKLHDDNRRRSQQFWRNYDTLSWRFFIHSFSGTRTVEKRNEIMGSFRYMDFKGPIRMKNPDQEFHVMEEYIDDVEQTKLGVSQIEEPRRVFLGRKLGNSCREDMLKYDLKKRRYISTTSMDAELSLVTANMALAAPGKLFFDPFVGTGSFTVCAAHFGALTLGSDIDGRSFRGKDSTKLGVYENFIQYGTKSKFIDTLTSDLVNTPFRRAGFLDGIVCDPPYGVREGLRVLGARKGKPAVNVIIDGVPAYLYVFFPKYPAGL